MTTRTRLIRIANRLFLAILAAGLLSQLVGRDSPDELLREATSLLERRDMAAAEETLRIVAREGEAEQRRIAFHNLGWIQLQRARGEAGTEARSAAEASVRYSEESLRLGPGAALNLELALRRLSELDASAEPAPNASARPTRDPASDPERKVQDTRADTEEGKEQEEVEPGRASADGGASPEAADRPDPEPAGDAMSAAEAIRFLASFQLMESERSVALVRLMLEKKPGTSRGVAAGRPPW